MMVNQLDTGAGRLRVARLFRKGSVTHHNGSHKAVRQWDSAVRRVRWNTASGSKARPGRGAGT